MRRTGRGKVYSDVTQTSTPSMVTSSSRAGCPFRPPSESLCPLLVPSFAEAERAEIAGTRVKSSDRMRILQRSDLWWRTGGPS